jgi:Homeodomain-like domain
MIFWGIRAIQVILHQGAGAMQKRYRVTLTEEERKGLQALVSTGKSAARKLVRARILLLADQAQGGPAKADPDIVAAPGCGRATVERARQQFVEEGLDETLTPRPTTRTYQRRLDGKAEAHLVAMACSAPPKGRARWTLRLLADRLVALGYVETIAHETVRQTLQKTNSSRG